jgi:hypothetical protein
LASIGFCLNYAGYFNALTFSTGYSTLSIDLAIAYSLYTNSCFSCLRGILYSFLTAEIDLVTVLLNVAFFSTIALDSFVVYSSTFGSYSFLSTFFVVYF